MKRQVKNIVFVAASITSILANAVPATACGGSGGGFQGGYGGGFARSGSIHRAAPAFNSYHSGYQRQAAYPQPSFHQQNYAQPTYLQPTYSQPHYNQPTRTTYPQATYSQPASRSTFAQPAPSASPAASAVRQVSRTQTTSRQGDAFASQRRSTQAVPQASQSTVSSRANVTRPSTTSKTVQAPATGNAAANALQMLASIASTQVTPQVQTSPVVETASVIPEFSTPNASTAASTTVGVHVGTWKVQLPSNQSVTLTLNANGTFAWTATKDGKSSSFDGQYRLADGRLTLVRSADLQQMAGSWSGASGAFTFKLDGAKHGGLSFQRS